MLNKISRVENPLTIIAVFSGITEVAAASALPFLTAEVQATFVWFLITFPFALIAAFFLTLNFNTKALYAPGDYRDDKYFLQALQISSEATEIRVTEPDADVPQIEQIAPADSATKGPTPFEGVSRQQLKAANAFMQGFQPFGSRLMKEDIIGSWGFGVHGDGLFLFNVGIKPFGNHTQKPPENFIIRTVEQADNRVELSVVGRPIRSTDPAYFAQLVSQSIEATAKQRRRHEGAEA